MSRFPFERASIGNGSDFVALVVGPPRIGPGKTRMPNDFCFRKKMAYQVMKLTICPDAIPVVRFYKIKRLELML